MKIPLGTLLLAVEFFINFSDGADSPSDPTRPSRDRYHRRQSTQSSNPAATHELGAVQALPNSNNQRLSSPGRTSSHPSPELEYLDQDEISLKLDDNASFKGYLNLFNSLDNAPKWLLPTGEKDCTWLPEVFIRVDVGEIVDRQKLFVKSTSGVDGFQFLYQEPKFAQFFVPPNNYFMANDFKAVTADDFNYNIPKVDYIYVAMPRKPYPKYAIYSSILKRYKPVARPEKQARKKEHHPTPPSSSSKNARSDLDEPHEKVSRNHLYSSFND